MSGSHKKRVFILGSGFSKQAGMPLATELTKFILNRPIIKDLEEMQTWIQDITNRIAKLNGYYGNDNKYKLNIEQLFQYARYDVMLWQLRHQSCPVGRSSGDTPYRMAESIDTWLSYLKEELPIEIWGKQKQASLSPINNFARNIVSSDSIVTFNYDTLIEDAWFYRLVPI